MDIETSVILEIISVFKEEGIEFDREMLEKPVLELGVDSLTYAILVTRLQNVTGRDPYTENPHLPYPRLLADFVQAYLT
jgi:acyl carrier protein